MCTIIIYMFTCIPSSLCVYHHYTQKHHMKTYMHHCFIVVQLQNDMHSHLKIDLRPLGSFSKYAGLGPMSWRGGNTWKGRRGKNRNTTSRRLVINRWLFINRWLGIYLYPFQFGYLIETVEAIQWQGGQYTDISWIEVGEDEISLVRQQGLVHAQNLPRCCWVQGVRLYRALSVFFYMPTCAIL